MLSRTMEFNGGVAGNGEVASSLTNDSMRFMAKVPGKFSPQSVLQQYMLDPRNGNSATDAARQTPQGQIPSLNGIAADTASKLYPTFGSTRPL